MIISTADTVLLGTVYAGYDSPYCSFTHPKYNTHNIEKEIISASLKDAIKTLQVRRLKYAILHERFSPHQPTLESREEDVLNCPADVIPASLDLTIELHLLGSFALGAG